MDNKLIINRIFLFIFALFVFFMGIGYASVSFISFDLYGTAQAKMQDGIYITDFKYVGDVNADFDNCKVYNIYQTNFKSNVVLSDIDVNSSISYQITIYNSTDFAYVFDKVDYEFGEDTYSNENIIFELTDLNENTMLYNGEDITFTITFKYKDNVLSSTNSLVSYLNFKFKPKTYDFNYVGNYEMFEPQIPGVYKLEVWGAQGGIARINDLVNIGGYGAYSVGNTILSVDEKLYVAVGGTGSNHIGLVAPDPPEELTIDITPGGFNGGGYSVYSGRGSGGGATAIYKTLINDGQLKNYKNNISDILIVAGGGGGGQVYNETNGIDFSGIGGHAGGYIGGSGTLLSETAYGYGTGGTQTAGGGVVDIKIPQSAPSATYGSFGEGASVKCSYRDLYIYSSGGGGGFYGGGAVEHGPAGGGSGYIGNSLLSDKSMYCYNCEQSSEMSSKTISVTDVSDLPVANHAKIGNGYAKITYLRKI